MDPPAPKPPGTDLPDMDLEDMDLPIILISDFEEDPPVTMRYVNGDNELDFEVIYRNISHLSSHPGRGYLEQVAGSNATSIFRIKKCDQAFLNAFWNCASNLCDYFADFLTYDTAVMQGIWFALLDRLQQAAILPHQFWLSEVPSCEHSQAFTEDCKWLRAVIEDLVEPRKNRRFESIAGRDQLFSTRLNIDPGGLKSGLKTWQQFLYKDSPGFAVPSSERVYPDTAPDTLDHTTFEMHIPRGGLALVDRHTKKLRMLAEEISQGLSDAEAEASELADFNRKTLAINHASTYTAIDGRQMVLKPMYPNPESEQTPQRLPGPFDPSFMLPTPNLQLVNECVGIYKGKDVFRHADTDEKFHMLSFGSPGDLQSRSFQSRVSGAAYSDQYDS